YLGKLYVKDGDDYKLIDQVFTALRSAKYREILNTATFRRYRGDLYAIDPTLNYVKVDKHELAGYTGEGCLQYRKAFDGEIAGKDGEYKNVIVELNGEYYMPVDTDGDGYTSAAEADANMKDAIDNNRPSNVTYVLDGNFAAYNKAISLDLSKLKDLKIADMLADLQSLELGANLDITLKVSNIINWAHQMTKFINGSDTPTTSNKIVDYLYFLIGSLEYAADQATTSSEVSLKLNLKAYLPTQNLIDIIANNDPDRVVTFLDVVNGLKAYVELVYTTGLHDDSATSRLWIEIKDGKLDAYHDMHEMGTLVGLGNFFDYGRLDGFDLTKLFGEASASAVKEAVSVVSADVQDENNYGLIPENIWGTLNMLIGRLLIAGDFMTIGLNEALLSDLVAAFANSGNDTLQDLAETLPKLYTTNNSDTSGVTLNFTGNAPSIDINFGFEVGEDYYMTVSQYNAKFGASGTYANGKGTDWNADYAFKKNTDGSYSPIEFNSTTSKYSSYVYVSSEKYILISYAFPNWNDADYASWEGETYDYNTATGEFVLHTGAGKGLYMPIGDFRLSASLYGLYVKVNEDFSVNPLDKFPTKDTDGDGVNDAIDDSKFVEIHNMKAYLNMSLNVSLYGAGAVGDDNTIDLSEMLDLLLDLLVPEKDMGKSQFKINITNELGRNNAAYLKLNLHAIIDLATGEIGLSAVLQRYVTGTTNSYSTLIGIHLLNDATDGDVVYLDLSGLLGSTAKVKLSGIGIKELLKESIDKLIGRVGGTVANDEATTAAASEIGIVEDMMMDTAYLMLLFRPHEVLVQLNADLVNAVYRKILQIRGEPMKDLIPDVGDWLLAIRTNSSNKTS
ncbi:MAG: hypothetical protein K2N18_01740, partial [Clostridia bacterium]|nr:hypothetical protein [Clostridia bacterium]